MKKSNAMLFAALLLVSGCSPAQSAARVQVSWRGNSAEVSKEDAETVQKLFAEIMDEDLQPLQEDEHYIGGFPHTFRIDDSDETVSYSFMMDTLSVVDSDRNLYEFRLDEQLYKEKVYPSLSKIIENYLPLSVQLSSPLGIILKVNGSSEEVNEESLFLFINEMVRSLTKWSAVENYDGTYDDEMAYIVFSDTVISETIHLFSDFMVIRQHILPYTDPAFPESFLNSTHN